MSKRAVAIFLALHTAVSWAAVALRFDEFPLTWAPMYAVRGAPLREATFAQRLLDRDRLETEAWLGTRRDGGEEWIGRRDLNVPRRAIGRLHGRTWGKEPPAYAHKNSGGLTLDRWLRGLPAGARLVHADWRRKLLVSINKTLGRAPRDADFLVRLRAERSVVRFDSASLAPLGRELDRAEIVWRDAWSEDFR